MIILYVQYGKNPELANQLRYSLCSALHHREKDKSKFRIVVLSENAESISQLPVELIHLSREKVKEWSLDYTYSHRIKLNAIAYILSLYNERTIYVDADTYFVRSPQKIFDSVSESCSVLHSTEYYNPAEKKEWLSIREGMTENTRNSQKVIDFSIPMYNAGVIGIHPKQGDLIEKSIKMLDLFLRSDNKLHTLEQYAVSNVLWSHGAIVTCEKYVVHYWDRKDIIGYIIKKIIEKHSVNGCLDYLSIGRELLQVPKLPFNRLVYFKLLHLLNIYPDKVVNALRQLALIRSNSRMSGELLNILSLRLLQYLIKEKIDLRKEGVERQFRATMPHNIQHKFPLLNDDVKSQWLHYWCAIGVTRDEATDNLKW